MSCISSWPWFLHWPKLMTTHICPSGALSLLVDVSPCKYHSVVSRNLGPFLFSISWLLALGSLDFPSAPRKQHGPGVLFPCCPPTLPLTTAFLQASHCQIYWPNLSDHSHFTLDNFFFLASETAPPAISCVSCSPCPGQTSLTTLGLLYPVSPSPTSLGTDWSHCLSWAEGGPVGDLLWELGASPVPPPPLRVRLFLVFLLPLLST